MEVTPSEGKVRQGNDAPKKSARKPKGRGYGPRNGTRFHGKKCAERKCQTLVARGRCDKCRKRAWARAKYHANVEVARRKLREKRARTKEARARWPCLDCGKLGPALRCKPCANLRTAYLHLVTGPRVRGRRVKEKRPGG